MSTLPLTTLIDPLCLAKHQQSCSLQVGGDTWRLLYDALDTSIVGAECVAMLGIGQVAWSAIAKHEPMMQSFPSQVQTVS